MIKTIVFALFGLALASAAQAVLASLSARRHDHASPYGLRSGYGHGQRCLRGQNHHAPRAPLCAMEWWRLRSPLLSVL
jgi:hypothetical protein